MARNDLDAIFGRIDTLDGEIATFVPVATKAIQFRADLAGLLVVAIAASYESCVKETLISYAARHHLEFAVFAQNQFQKLNSRINLSDLFRYARNFGNPIHKKFSEVLNERKAKILLRTGKDFSKAYEQILSWRHDFAHTGSRNTTIEEAMATHRLAKRVLYAFDDGFN
ncbi:MAG TPA: HEPN domain-containing protein [Allosphingosinicella sp.]|jgi:hypothetical protein|nr:HEPN domain-containing protein [Allosphingosinicella sp.]